MNQNQTTESGTFTLPEGQLCAYTCGDCLWTDLNEQDNQGRYWCTRNRAYYYPYESGSSCSGYRTR